MSEVEIMDALREASGPGGGYLVVICKSKGPTSFYECSGDPAKFRKILREQFAINLEPPPRYDPPPEPSKDSLEEKLDRIIEALSPSAPR